MSELQGRGAVKLKPLDPDIRIEAVQANESIFKEPRLKSALQEYSMLFDELQKEKLNSNNVAKQILEPKMDYINDILGQHLLQKEFTETFRNLQSDIGQAKVTPFPRIFVDNTAELKELLMKAFYKGNEKEFFKIRDKLYDELNYYKLDYSLDPALELKQKAYFTVYYLIPMNKKKVGFESDS